ncbi:shikimate dehydrogenase [Catellatospora citrea]|uniref:shikimate dehydrogenase n=1 Tax=Catellatospora citrea TaxID=53366 RepID=UPI0033FD0FE5
MARGRRFLVGLIGGDLGPSLSPALHEREADELGVRYLYQLIDLDVLDLGAEDVGALVTQAGQFGFAGLNITHPSKQTVVKYLDELSADAAALGAVNTVVFRQGRAVGHNTDWSGFLTGFRRGLPGAAVGDVVLLGAGGAGTAVAFALVRLGVRRLTVVDLAVERAEQLAEVVRQSAADQPVTVHTARTVEEIRDRLAGAGGLVNATPVGMSGDGATPLPAGLLRPEMWVADIVYRPLLTELLRQARAAGCRTLDGGGMVVAQAAETFHLITGLSPDLERMYRHFSSLTAAATS